MTDKEVEDKFIALETKIAYLEEFTSELQNVVVEHTKTIDRLTTANRLMSEKITEIIENSEEIPNRKPPHY